MNRKFVSAEVRKLLFSFFKRVFNSCHYNILHCLLQEAVARGFDDLSDNRFKYVNVSGIRLPFNYNF